MAKPNVIDLFSTFIVVDTYSQALVNELADKGYPPLSVLPNGKPGRILIGEPDQFDKIPPPRVIFRPVKAGFEAPDMGLGPVRKADDANDPERRTAIQNRAIFTEAQTFEFWVCGLAPDGSFDPNADIDYDRIDYEYTRALYHALLGAMQYITPNAFDVSAGGIWAPKRHTTRIAREFVGRVELRIPIRAKLTPTTRAATGTVAGFPYAPADVSPNVTDSMTGFAPDGTPISTPGCE